VFVKVGSLVAAPVITVAVGRVAASIAAVFLGVTVRGRVANASVELVGLVATVSIARLVAALDIVGLLTILDMVGPFPILDKIGFVADLHIVGLFSTLDMVGPFPTLDTIGFLAAVMVVVANTVGATGAVTTVGATGFVVTIVGATGFGATVVTGGLTESFAIVMKLPTRKFVGNLKSSLR
jgi:hypothetical protein